MFDLTIRADAKDFFFDRAKVQKLVKDKERVPIIKALSYIRKTARNSLRPAKKAYDPPPKPPRTRTRGGRNLKSIQFYYDRKRSLGVVGPIKTGSKSVDGTGKRLPTVLPAFLHFGGSANVVDYQWQNIATNDIQRKYRRPQELTASQSKKLRPVNKRVRRVVYQPRPFMTDALNVADQEGVILDAWKNIVVG